MAPKKREQKNIDLTGTNINVRRRGDKDYFYYVMPDSWRHHPNYDGKMEQPLHHGDRKKSIEAALQLNVAIRGSSTIADRLIHERLPTGKNPKFTYVVELFRDNFLPAQGYSERSFKERIIRINQYLREWPRELCSEMDTFKIAQFMRPIPWASARQHRVLLDQIFRYAASEGYQTTRPMLDLERRKVEKRKRARHTWEGHLAIYEAAPDWLRRAINIALYSLRAVVD